MFSLNFSSAGKGPFMDGKAKNIYFSKRGEGGQWSEGHGPTFTGKFFIPIFKDLFYANLLSLSLGNKLKRLIPIILLCLQTACP